MKLLVLVIAVAAVFLTEAVSHKRSCFCSDLYEPVCSPAGNTYSNECYADCENVDIATLTPGRCSEKQAKRHDARLASRRYDECVCIDVIDPVCGDGVTYNNICLAQCGSASVIEAGECSTQLFERSRELKKSRDFEKRSQCNCGQIWAPVCSESSNISYSNYCVANCNGKFDLTSGLCN